MALSIRRSGRGRFSTFSGRESNCQFDSRPFFCPQLGLQMSEWPMRGHFRYLSSKTFPMTPRTPQCKVFWALLSSSKHSGVPEDSKSPTLEVLGFTPTLGQSGVATLEVLWIRTIPQFFFHYFYFWTWIWVFQGVWGCIKATEKAKHAQQPIKTKQLISLSSKPVKRGFLKVEVNFSHIHNTYQISLQV
jgi:hypothetical protein